MSSYSVDTISTSSIRTTTGDLVLNPAGSNINCSSKTLTNVVVPSSALAVPVSLSGAGSTSNVLQFQHGSPSTPLGAIQADGSILLGGGTSYDCALYRSAANTLTLGSLKSNAAGTFRTTGIRVDDIKVNDPTQRWISIAGNNVAGTAGGTFGAAIAVGSGTFGPLTNTYCALIACGINNTCTHNHTASNCLIAASDGATINSASPAGGGSSSMISCGTSTLNSSGGYNMIFGAPTGSAIGGSASGSFLWGSNINTTNSNVFALSDSSATAVNVGAAGIFQGRFRSGYYLATNAGNSIGLSMGASANAWTTISDARLKNIHREISGNDILSALERMRVVNFNYHDDEEERGPRIGMIAQEVNCVLEDLKLRKKNIVAAHPYCARYSPDDPIQGVSGDEIAYLSVAAIKALTVKVAALEGENASLRAEMTSLGNAFRDLKESIAK
jgi:Chaperone of endosialidase